MGRNEPACTASGVRLVIRAYIMTCSVCRRRTAPTEPAANYGRVGVRLSPGLRAVDRAPEWSNARMAEADRGPAVPGRPADHLPGVQAGGLLAELVILFTAEVPVAVAVGRAGNEQLHYGAAVSFGRGGAQFAADGVGGGLARGRARPGPRCHCGRSPHGRRGCRLGGWLPPR